MPDEGQFNRYAAEEFAREYERETGISLVFVREGRPFPDAILQTGDGQEVGVEFVSVVLAFLSQEQSYFHRYRQRMLAALEPERPRYAGIEISLQPCSSVVDSQRPIRLPNIESADGRLLIAELVWIVQHRALQMPPPGGQLLEQLASLNHPLSTTRRFFGALSVTPISGDDPRKLHRDDPVIENPTMVYSTDELANAVARALHTKESKGYGTDILVLHTLPVPGQRHFPTLGMCAQELVDLGREMITNELSGRFEEIWLLGDCFVDGKRARQLK